MQLIETAAGHPSHLSVGERLHVKLAETPTTGYRWKLGNGCANLLDTTGEEEIPTETPPGAAGRHRWSFLAKAPGECELRFESARAWEPHATGKTLIFPIVIAAAK